MKKEMALKKLSEINKYAATMYDRLDADNEVFGRDDIKDILKEIITMSDSDVDVYVSDDDKKEKKDLCFSPTNLDGKSIYDIADSFCKATKFNAGDDITKFVKSIGGKIIIDNDDCIDSSAGGIEVKKNKKFIIHLTTYVPELMDNYAIAHNLGHFVLHSDLGKKEGKTTKHNDSLVNLEADAFAAEMLMPSELFMEKCKHEKDMENVAKFFNIPLSIAMNRKLYLDSILIV